MLNQLTTVSNLSCSYDANGNLTARVYTGNGPKTYSYAYDDENQLISAATDTYYTYSSARWKSEYTYDGRQRLRKRVDYTWNTQYSQWQVSAETRYIYAGNLVIQERNSFNTPTVSYVRGTDLSGSREGVGGIGGLLARSDQYSAGAWGRHVFYHADGNGNVTYLVDSSQALAAKYRYDPFGNTTYTSGTLATANVYRFSSKAVQPNSGLYYYGYRFYDPYLQRWLKRDPTAERGGINLYGYGGNEPTEQIDPFGLAGMETDWGGTPWYNPSPSKGNCWRHACDDPMKPGEVHSPNPPGWDPSLPPGTDPQGKASCAKLISDIKTSGAGEDVNESGKCREGYNKVVVQYSDSTQTRNPQRDYHFVREGSKPGTWCDKRGYGPERTYPKEPSPLASYTKCGYLCIKKGWDIDAPPRP
jgi:RHS repeat-associated protein